MKDYLDFFKLPPTILTVISIVAGCILFLPESILVKMGLSEIGSPYNIIIGVLFLLASTLVFMYLIKHIYSLIKEKRFEKKFPIIFKKLMEELSDEEKTVIYLIYNKNDKTAPLPIGSGITLRLSNKMIIQRTTNMSFTGPNLEIPYTLSNATLNYLCENPNYFD